MRLSRLPKPLIVVGAAPAAILDMEHGIIVHMGHLMEHGCNGVLNRAVKGSRPDVDFPASMSLDIPGVIGGVMAVCAGSALDGDNRRFQFAIEKIGVELAEQFSNCPASREVLTISFITTS